MLFENQPAILKWNPPEIVTFSIFLLSINGDYVAKVANVHFRLKQKCNLCRGICQYYVCEDSNENYTKGRTTNNDIQQCWHNQNFSINHSVNKIKYTLEPHYENLL